MSERAKIDGILSDVAAQAEMAVAGQGVTAEIVGDQVRVWRNGSPIVRVTRLGENDWEVFGVTQGEFFTWTGKTDEDVVMWTDGAVGDAVMGG